ncbi:MAG: Sensory transduction protein LytR [Paracidovorax wautersii]|uniref:Sensory transduction protein LytR n=1 Tax=Paracidovorax wautersii TaxID=1177982 RepID=A0A7V8FLK6_9BURK|nr:MAG: Sensory transduction protein LytR [Paracidovorax wautersii]
MQGAPGRIAAGWRVLVIDGEPLARLHLKQLLVETAVREGCVQILEAGSAGQAIEMLGAPGLALASQAPLRLVVADMRHLGREGLWQLAAALRQCVPAPQLILVTAHANDAVPAFALQACDYLTKPVSHERLRLAIRKAGQAWLATGTSRPAPAPGEPGLLVDEGGRQRRIPLREVVYVQAELKYLTVRTQERTHLMSATLLELEARHPDHFVRVHRNALASREAIDGVVRRPAAHTPDGAAAGWHVRLRGIEDTLAISRRQLTLVLRALGLVGGNAGEAEGGA